MVSSRGDELQTPAVLNFLEVLMKKNKMAIVLLILTIGLFSSCDLFGPTKEEVAAVLIDFFLAAGEAFQEAIIPGTFTTITFNEADENFTLDNHKPAAATYTFSGTLTIAIDLGAGEIAYTGDLTCTGGPVETLVVNINYSDDDTNLGGAVTANGKEFEASTFTTPGE